MTLGETTFIKQLRRGEFAHSIYTAHYVYMYSIVYIYMPVYMANAVSLVAVASDSFLILILSALLFFLDVLDVQLPGLFIYIHHIYYIYNKTYAFRIFLSIDTNWCEKGSI